MIYCDDNDHDAGDDYCECDDADDDDDCNCQSGLVTNIHILDSGIALVNKRRFNFLQSNMFCFCDSTILSCLV